MFGAQKLVFKLALVFHICPNCSRFSVAGGRRVSDERGYADVRAAAPPSVGERGRRPQSARGGSRAGAGADGGAGRWRRGTRVQQALTAVRFQPQVQVSVRGMEGGVRFGG